MSFRKIDNATKTQATLLLQRGHWRPDAFAKQTPCHTATAYRWETQLQRYGKLERPHYQRRGPNHRV